MSERIEFVTVDNSKKPMDRIRRIRDYFKSSLGLAEFEYVKEIFFHIGMSKFEYKLLITRRAYLLYEIFDEIFSAYPNEIDAFGHGEKWDPFGEFYNSHSMCFLKDAFNNNDDAKKLLVVDDIIVHGRAVSQICDDLMNNLSVNTDDLYFWCLYRNFSAKRISEKVEKRLKVYKTVSEQTWKKDSYIFTKAIIDRGLGYTSYVDTYLYRNFDKKWWSNFLSSQANGSYTIVNLDNEKLYTNLKAYMYENYDLHPYIFFKKEAFNHTLKCAECLRFYIEGDDLLIVPYLFVSSIRVVEAYDYTVLLLKHYNISKIPEEFSKQVIQDDADAAISFLKWAVNRIGKEIVSEFFENVNVDTLEVVKHIETFRLKNEGGTELSNISVDRTEFQSNKATDEMDFCIQKFKETVNEFAPSSEKEDFLPTLEDLQKIYIQYSFKIKEIDERNAQIPEEDRRCIGIRFVDVYEYLQTKYNNIDDVARQALLCNLLSLFILQWDTGEASYNLYSVNTENCKECFISGFMRNGEQVYRQIYRLYPNVYPYFNYFTQKVFEYRIDELFKLGEYLKRIFYKQKHPELIQEVDEFQQSLRLNSSYFNDCFVVYPRKFDKNVAETIENYIAYNYNNQ